MHEIRTYALRTEYVIINVIIFERIIVYNDQNLLELGCKEMLRSEANRCWPIIFASFKN